MAKPSGFRFGQFRVMETPANRAFIHRRHLNQNQYPRMPPSHVSTGNILLGRFSWMIKEIGKLYALWTMVKIVICLLWQCNYFILVRNNLAFLHAYLCCLMKILLPNSSTWFSRGLKVRIWSSSVCIHVKQISAGTAGNQLTMTPVFQMFWQNCFLETNLGTGNVEQVFIWMKMKVLAANSLQVCELLQCACHAGQLTLSWLQHLCQLNLAAAQTHRATWVRTRPSQLSHWPTSSRPKWFTTLLKVELRAAGPVLESCEFRQQCLVIDLSGAGGKVVVRTCRDLPHGVVQLQPAGASRADSANSGTCCCRVVARLSSRRTWTLLTPAAADLCCYKTWQWHQ